MPQFAYSAVDAGGQESSGTLDAPDRAAAVKQLCSRGLQPFKVAESAGAAQAAGKTGAAKSGAAKSSAPAKAAAQEESTGPLHLSAGQVQMFTEELAELLEAGMRLEPALKLMEGRTDAKSIPAHRRMAHRVGNLVREGHPFSSAIKAASPSFGELFCSVAAAGEAGGSLATAMRRQAVYIANSREMRSKVATALIYPSFLLVSAIAVTVLFSTFLIPRLTSLITSIRGTLPPAIKMLIGASDFLRHWWWLVLALLALMGLFAWMYARSPTGKPVWHQWKLKLPAAGNVILAGFHTQFLETLASLTGGGLPLLRGLELASRVTPNVYIQGQLDRTIESVRDGGALSRAMEKTGLFPTTLVEMVRLGEHTGDLSAALRRAADRCGRDLGRKLEKTVALMQPVIILVMACLVGVMAYLMISVIFQTVSMLRTR